MTVQDTARYLELVLEAGNRAIWDSRLQGNDVTHAEVIWRDGGAALIGLMPEPITHPFLGFISAVHPEDRALVVDTMQKAIDD